MNKEKILAILMADLTGYTTMTDVHGSSSAASLVARYMEIVSQSLTGTARLIQRIGDQVVIVAETPDDLAATSLNLTGLAHEENNFLGVHSGLHIGPILEQEGNLFGSTINVCARIMNAAIRGQVLCSPQFVSAVSSDTLTFETRGVYRFKNVKQEMELFELTSVQRASTQVEVDPVCHMIVQPGSTGYMYAYQGRTYHFCGLHCLEIFKADPFSVINE